MNATVTSRNTVKFRSATPLLMNRFVTNLSAPEALKMLPSDSTEPIMRMMVQGTCLLNSSHVSRFRPGNIMMARPMMATVVTFSSGTHVPRIHSTGSARIMTSARTSKPVGLPASSAAWRRLS